MDAGLAWSECVRRAVTSFFPPAPTEKIKSVLQNAKFLSNLGPLHRRGHVRYLKFEHKSLRQYAQTGFLVARKSSFYHCAERIRYLHDFSRAIGEILFQRPLSFALLLPADRP